MLKFANFIDHNLHRVFCVFLLQCFCILILYSTHSLKKSLLIYGSDMFYYLIYFYYIKCHSYKILSLIAHYFLLQVLYIFLMHLCIGCHTFIIFVSNESKDSSEFSTKLCCNHFRIFHSLDQTFCKMIL